MPSRCVSDLAFDAATSTSLMPRECRIGTCVSDSAPPAIACSRSASSRELATSTTGISLLAGSSRSPCRSRIDSAPRMSASITATRLTAGKWWPLVSICVPSRIPGSPRLMRLTRSRIACRACMESLSTRNTGHRANRWRRNSSVCSVPSPAVIRLPPWHWGHRCGICLPAPQWWQRKVRSIL